MLFILRRSVAFVMLTVDGMQALAQRLQLAVVEAQKADATCCVDKGLVAPASFDRMARAEVAAHRGRLDERRGLDQFPSFDFSGRNDSSSFSRDHDHAARALQVR